MKDYTTFDEAALICPGSPQPPTLARWRREGIKSRPGVIVKLKCVRVGKRFYTTEAWLQEFFDEVARLDQVQQEAPQADIQPIAGSSRQRLIEEGVL